MTSYLDPEDAQQIIETGNVACILRMAVSHASGDLRVKANELYLEAAERFRESVVQHVTEQP